MTDGLVTDETVDWTSRVALVTGANRGIGFAVARGLGRLGLTVLVGSRDAGRGEDATAELRAEGLRACCLQLAVTDDASVAAAARAIDDEFGRLDALVNNAAIRLEPTPSPPSECSLATVQETFDTNVFGALRVLLAMVPLMRRAPAPRIVNVSSGAGSMTLAMDPESKYFGRPSLSYNSSKAALNAITVQFAAELWDTPFKVNSVNPGLANTEMTKDTPGVRSPDTAAGIVVRLATLPPEGPTGGYFREGAVLPW